MDHTYHSGIMEVALNKELHYLYALANNQEANVEQNWQHNNSDLLLRRNIQVWKMNEIWTCLLN